MRQARLVLRCALGLALFCAARPALAQMVGYDLERLWLDPSARGSLVLGTGETLPAGGARLTLAGGWERAPLVSTDEGLRGRGLLASAHRNGDVVRNRWTLHITGAAAVTSRLELGVRLPMTVSQRGPSDVDLRARLTGTPSLMARYGITQQANGSFLSTAFALEAAFPVAHPDDLAGNPRPYFVPRLEVGHRFDSFLLAADVGANLRPHALELGDERLKNELTAGAVFATVGKPFRYEVSLRGAFNRDGLGAHGELLGGVRWGFRYGEVFALAGPGLGDAPGTPTVRALVGLALFRTGEAAPPPPPPPPPPAADPCAAGQTHTPEQCPALDDDADGIPNGQDKCPLEPGIAELQGCPAKDSDGDGVPDHLDKCPDVKGDPKYQGCPVPDRDGDSVPDDVDKCPDQPGLPELEGCPPKRAEIKGEKIDIHEKVFFDVNKATVQPRSYPLLDDVAKLIVANPQVGKIRVEGHTDSTGSPALNRKLSQARAEAVKDYFVGKGVEAGRLEAEGFGPDRPTASNKTKAGREANRRVEFTILGAEKK